MQQDPVGHGGRDGLAVGSAVLGPVKENDHADAKQAAERRLQLLRDLHVIRELVFQLVVTAEEGQALERRHWQRVDLLHGQEELAHRAQAGPRHAVHVVHKGVRGRVDPRGQRPEGLEDGRGGKRVALDLGRGHQSREGGPVSAEQDGRQHRRGRADAVAHDRDAPAGRLLRKLHDVLLREVHHGPGAVQDARVRAATEEGLLGAHHVGQGIRSCGRAPNAKDDLIRLGVDSHEEARAADAVRRVHMLDVVGRNCANVVSD
mmetsp:Transcript_26556/g.76486  ORF Transcript_26556/g.76486 Transcript_26556/m.76486 type:complete len:261 (-) Transcript_26556:372-1154(-)